MPSAYRYLLVDVDGTLLNSRGAVSARTLAALHAAVAAGLTLVLATGRMVSSLRRITAGLALPPHHMITNGGAVGLIPGGAEVRHTSYLAPELWRAVVAALEAEGLAPLVFSHRHPEPPLFYVAAPDGRPPPGAHFDAYVSRNRPLRREVPDLARADVPRVLQVAALGRDTAFDAASASVLARFAGRSSCHSMVLNILGDHGTITEFFAPGTTKWQAFLGLFPEAAGHAAQVIAIGDEANDLEMIRAAGLGIAMGNAIPAVQAAADRVTGDNDHDGVAEAIEGVLGELGDG